jgi:Glutathione S-transferase, C-terminal domain
MGSFYFLLILLILNINATQITAFVSSAKSLAKAAAFPEIVAALDSFDDHLAYRTFLVGHSISAADFMLWGSLKGKIPPSLIPPHLCFPSEIRSESQGHRSAEKRPTRSSSSFLHIHRYTGVHAKCFICSYSVKVKGSVIE